jgi:arsenate reductase
MLIKSIEETIQALNFDAISDERKIVLQSLIAYVQQKVSANKNVNLNFICTHNSRRSHLSQVWAQTAAHYYSVKNVFCYSGGTEATAMFPMAAKALEVAGFQITKLSQEQNPIYAVKYAQNEHPLVCFSKTFEHSFNPKSEFAAIMTCAQADEGCPLILGCEARIPVRYDDPKAFDNTPQQKEKYIERSLQIAAEMCFVFSQIKK